MTTPRQWMGIRDLLETFNEDRENEAASTGVNDQWGYDRRTTTRLTYGYQGGVASSAAGALTRVASGSVLLTPSATNYVERTYLGVVSANTIGFTVDGIAMAVVVTGATGIASVADYRNAQAQSAAALAAEATARVNADALALAQWGPTKAVGGFTGRNYTYAGGTALVAGVATQIANGSLTLPDNAVSYVERTYAGVVSTNTTGFTAGLIAMAKVTAASGSITVVDDWRPMFGPFPYYAPKTGEVSVTNVVYPYGFALRHGAPRDGTNAATAVQAAIDSVTALGIGVVDFGDGGFTFTSGLQVSSPYITFRGRGQELTTLTFAGAGTFIQLGTDDGLAYDRSGYDGVARGFTLEGMQLLTNGTDHLGGFAQHGGTYKIGTYAIRDWRGGSLNIRNASIQHFEYGVWGVQSDVNRFSNLLVQFNKQAFWLGPRSDQPMFDQIWSAGNDSVFSFNGIQQVLVAHWETDTDGSATTFPVTIHEWALTGRTTANIVFDTPWLETNGSFGFANPGYDVEAFFDLNTGDAHQNGFVEIRTPHVKVFPFSDATKPHVQYLAKIDHLGGVDVTGVSSEASFSWTGLRAVFKVINGAVTTARPRFSEKDLKNTASGGNLIESYSASPVFVQLDTQGFNTTYGVNVSGGTGAVFTGQLGLLRSLQHNGSVPTSGQNADLTLNHNWSAGQDPAWLWDVTSGKGVPLHAPTISADRGDASVTLTPGTDVEEQRFLTPLTGFRTVTLSTTGALNGHSFRVTRAAASTGSSQLSVGGLVALNPGQWAEVAYNGTAWELRAFGSLIKYPRMGVNQGDNSATLTTGNSEEEQYWSSIFTANRTATLSASNAVNGSRFHVTREATATGAFTLDIGPGLRSLSAGQWATVIHDGSVWRLRAFGSL